MKQVPVVVIHNHGITEKFTAERNRYVVLFWKLPVKRIFFIQNLLKCLFNCWKRHLTKPAFQNLQLSTVNSTSTLFHARVTLLWPNNYNNQCQCRRINKYQYMITSIINRPLYVVHWYCLSIFQNYYWWARVRNTCKKCNVCE
jgi:hypothetical protein